MADWPTAVDGQHMVSSTITSGTYGITITAPVSTNTKSSPWTEMHPALPFDVSGFYIQIVSVNTAVGYVLDIGVGAASSEVVVLPDFTWAASRANYGGPYVWFPVRIAKGRRVAARIQSTGASTFAIVNLIFVSNGMLAGPGFDRVTAHGAQTSGTSIPTTIDPGGSANTKGTWVTLGPTSNRISALGMTTSLSNATTASTLWTLDVGIGAGPTVVIPDLALRCEITVDEVQAQGHGCFPVSIPAGVDLKVRAKCSITDATDRLIRVALYGVG